MAGPNLKRLIEERMRDVGSPRGMTDLARVAEIQRGTLYMWFEDKSAPRTRELQRVADALGMPISDLWAAWAGDVRPQTPEESRIAELLFEAYRRGVHDGYRLCREGSTEPPQ